MGIDLDASLRENKFRCPINEEFGTISEGAEEYIVNLLRTQADICEEELGDVIELGPKTAAAARVKIASSLTDDEMLAIPKLLAECLEYKYLGYCHEVGCPNIAERNEHITIAIEQQA